MGILDSVQNKKDHELEILRRNAKRVFNETKEDKRRKEAETLLDAIDQELERRHLPGMIQTFKENYDDGFYGQKYLEEERNYKLAASQLCKDILAKDVFSELLASRAWEDLFERVKKIVNNTNLIQASFERPKLFDAIREQGNPEKFYPALYDCIHGDGTPSERLGRFAAMLDELGLAKWTYASYFLFLTCTDHCMFVKPDGMKKSIEKACYPLQYESSPSAQLYEEILQYSEWLKGKIAELEPRDMIDVQSFIWHMAPTGIHAED